MTSNDYPSSAATPTAGGGSSSQTVNHNMQHHQQQEYYHEQQLRAAQNRGQEDNDDNWSSHHRAPQVVDARPILPLAAFYMGDLRDGLPMVWIYFVIVYTYCLVFLSFLTSAPPLCHLFCSTKKHPILTHHFRDNQSSETAQYASCLFNIGQRLYRKTSWHSLFKFWHVPIPLHGPGRILFGLFQSKD